MELFCLVNFLVLVLGYACLICTRAISLLHPLNLYYLLHLIVFGLRPLAVNGLNLTANFEYMDWYPSTYTQIKTILLANLGLISLGIGSVLGCPRSGRFAQPITLTARERRSFGYSLVLSVPVVATSTLYAFWALGLNEQVTLSEDLYAGRKNFESGSAYFIVFKNGFTALAVSAVVVFGFKWQLWIPISLYTAITFFQGSGRFNFVYLAFSLTMAQAHRFRKLSSWKIAIAGLTVLILFVLAGEYRRYKRGGASNNSMVLKDMLARTPLGEGQEFGSYEFLAFVVSTVPDKTRSFTYFTQYSELLVKPIPRMVWKGKPSGPLLKSFNLNDFGNFNGLTISLIGAGWMSAGCFGVVAICFCTGLLIGREFRAFVDVETSAIRRVSYLVLAPVMIQWYRDGAVTFVDFVVFSLFPILVWFFVYLLLPTDQKR